MARKPNYAFERNNRAKAKAAKREAKRQAKLAAKSQPPHAEISDGEIGETTDNRESEVPSYLNSQSPSENG